MHILGREKDKQQLLVSSSCPSELDHLNSRLDQVLKEAKNEGSFDWALDCFLEQFRSFRNGNL